METSGAYCSNCWEEVSTGVLRCRACGAPFQGPEAEEILSERPCLIEFGAPAPSMGADGRMSMGFSMSFNVPPLRNYWGG